MSCQFVYPDTSRGLSMSLRDVSSFIKHTFEIEDITDAVANQMARIPSLHLNNGKGIPMLGFGLGSARATNRRRNGLASVADRGLIDTVVMATKAGYYHLDCAEAYGNETELGIAIKESGVPREKLYITTKNSGTIPTDTEKSFAESLDRLQLNYVDLYLVHAPFFAESPRDIQKKWADMEAILASGRAKSIGVSNFLQHHLETLLATAKVTPAINQIEYHPYLQHGDLISFHKKHNISIAAYGPLTSLTRGSPGPLDEKYKSLAEKYGVGEGDIALRWCLDQGVVPITTSGREDRLNNYLRAFDFKLTLNEVQEIAEIGMQKHFRGYWTSMFKEDDKS